MRRVFALATSFVSFGAGVAHADPSAEPVRLVYERGGGAERCPGLEEVRADVIRRLGYDPFRKDAKRTVSASIARGTRSLSVQVRLTTDAGEILGTRKLVSEKNDCLELAAAMTLAITIAIDPRRALLPEPAPVPTATATESGPPQPAESTKPLPKPVLERGPRALLPQKDAAETPSPDRDGGDQIRPMFGAGIMLSAGALPGVAAGIAANIGIQRRRLSVAVEGRLDLPSSEDAEGPGQVSASLKALTLVPCVLVLEPVHACAVGWLGAIHGTSQDVPNARADDSFFAAVAFRGRAEIPMTRWLSARLIAEGGPMLTDTELRLNGTKVWASETLYGSLGAGAEVHFP